jgi:hypothetical protein
MSAPRHPHDQRKEPPPPPHRSLKSRSRSPPSGAAAQASTNSSKSSDKHLIAPPMSVGQARPWRHRIARQTPHCVFRSAPSPASPLYVEASAPGRRHPPATGNVWSSTCGVGPRWRGRRVGGGGWCN